MTLMRRRRRRCNRHRISHEASDVPCEPFESCACGKHRIEHRIAHSGTQRLPEDLASSGRQSTSIHDVAYLSKIHMIVHMIDNY